MKDKWSCYDCMWHTDKCKNPESSQYREFIDNIKECDIMGKCNNEFGCSPRDLGEDI